MDQKQKEKQELEEEYNNYRQKLEEIKQKKQALEQKILKHFEKKLITSEVLALITYLLR